LNDQTGPYQVGEIGDGISLLGGKYRIQDPPDTTAATHVVEVPLWDPKSKRAAPVGLFPERMLDGKRD
jgi:hypothetical protein